jgi:hypothetical protein
MQKIVELKIEETKAVVGGNKTVSFAAPASATVTVAASAQASSSATAAAASVRYSL